MGPKVYSDPRNYGVISLSRVIEKSSQVGVTRVALDLGHEPIREVLHRFGIGRSPHTGFPGESAGSLPDRARWYATDKVSLAFGYGITATPLQLARAYAVFANGGVQQPVSLLALDGELPAGERVVSAEMAHRVLEVLHAVTGDEGTGRKARVSGYQVGGKTGTVHKLEAGGYARDRYVALFAGVAPVEAPRIVTVVVINEPKGDAHGGGSAAAPVFSRVAQAAMRLFNVPPEAAPVVAGAAAGRSGGGPA